MDSGQSSNDAFPSAIHIAACETLVTNLLPALEELHRALQGKAEQFSDAYNLQQSIELLAQGVRLFIKRCLVGIRADPARCEHAVEQSLALATPLARAIGYDRAAKIAHETFERGVTIRETASEMTDLPQETLRDLLDYRKLTDPENRSSDLRE